MGGGGGFGEEREGPPGRGGCLSADRLSCWMAIGHRGRSRHMPWRSASPFARPAGDPREGALAGPGFGLDKAMMPE